ncbi:TonB-linked SusC/RagA family outer membrane protein [Arcicella aurantiaca]|uniref:TonB-linked SusC/RagA family outer membrane protein n=1 Tax=Arcicella aurantiaca TaxID=591202 RepID=A0A316ECH2_9BACT|nr:SusC/RagA family TonB-linked outer membrane protein [Arcicella aurantiaca]PWK27840.1 TonB-linked SusC/RagA family outer membrane protein [Arcicella aurantiaca]
MKKNRTMLHLKWLSPFIICWFYLTNYTYAHTNLITNYALEITVSGKVTEANNVNSGIPGATVREKGTKNGVSANLNGEYTIKVKEGAILIFSAIGYNSKEVVVNKQAKINVSLETDNQALDEVIVTGYQKIDRANFTGAAVKLKTDDIKLAGTIDIGRMLEGRASGVSVQNVSGSFGAAPKIRVRGATSITGENKPLWVIDGVVLEDVVNISNDDLSSGNANTLLGSAVAGLNSDDIESFQILKDASATALYGARAMNGVVVITTKKGRVQPTTINYSSNFSVTLRPSYDSYNIMNSNEQMGVYAELERKGWLTYSDVSRRANSGIYGKMYDLISSYDATTKKFGLENTPEAKSNFLQRYASVNTDWFKILFRNSLTQEHSLSINSGSEAAQYYFSTSVYDDSGWSIADKVRRYTATMRANFNLSKKLSLGFITVGSIREQKAPGSQDRVNNAYQGKYDRDFDINPFSYALNTSRALTAYDENGNLEYFKRDFAPFNIIQESATNYLDLSQLDLKLQLETQYKFNKNLTYNVLGTMRYVNSTRENKTYETSNQANAYRAAESSTVREANKYLYRDPDNPEAEPVVVLPQGGIYKRNEDKLVNYYARHQLNWSKTFDEIHSVNVLLGQEIKFANREEAFFNGFGYQFDKGGIPFTDYRIIKQGLDYNFNYYGLENKRDRYVAFFSNASYAYKNKYIFNGTARIDGSNQLGRSASARYLPTWNISGSWNAKEEDFLKDNDLISRLSLRGTYGLTASMGKVKNSTAIFKNQLTTRPYLSEKESRIYIESLENSELTWEKQYETNIGFDLGLFNNRINLIVDAYQRKGFDLIGRIKTSGVGGQLFKDANYADMKSRGIDIGLSATVLNYKDFQWKTNLNYAINQSEITNLKSLPLIYDLTKQEGGAQQGYPVRSIFSLDFKGLNSNGIPTFVNEKGEVSTIVDIQSQETKYLKYEGSLDPTMFGGFSNSFKYKNWDFNVFVSFQGGNKIRLDSKFSEAYSDLVASPKEFSNRWVLPGDEAKTNIPAIMDARIASLLTGGEYPLTNYNLSSARVVNGDFVRLKNLSLGYTLPLAWATKIGFKGLSAKISATNIMLLYSDKRLLGQDPEFFGSGGVALPVPKQVSFSLKATL